MYVVLGATGKLGGLVVEALMAQGVAAADVLATGRNSAALHDLQSRGVRTASVAYDDVDALPKALDGADAVLLISGSEPGKRVQHHRNVVDAAKAVNVGHLVYTSVPDARRTGLFLAPDHKATEEYIEQQAIPATILRNNFYTEGFLGDFDKARELGVIANSVGDGRTASATRADFAEAAARALLRRDYDGEVLELGGDDAWSYAEFASTASDVLGRPVEYRPLTPDEEAAALRAQGLPEATIQRMALRAEAIRRGDVDARSNDLSGLLGRETAPLAETMRAWHLRQPR